MFFPIYSGTLLRLHLYTKLLLRNEVCHWSKGIQIQYNISQLEQWMHDQHIDDQELSPSITDTLQPIIQAAQLLQAPKSDADIANICYLRSRLTSAQLIQILHLYTLSDELEDRVSITFIRKVQEELQKRTDLQSQSNLLMDTKFQFTVQFLFKYNFLNSQQVHQLCPMCCQDWKFKEKRCMKPKLFALWEFGKEKNGFTRTPRQHQRFSKIKKK